MPEREDTMTDYERLVAIENDARKLIYISDGSTGSDKVLRLLNAIPFLIEKVRAAGDEIAARDQEDVLASAIGMTPHDAWNQGYEAAARFQTTNPYPATPTENP